MWCDREAWLQSWMVYAAVQAEVPAVIASGTENINRGCKNRDMYIVSVILYLLCRVMHKKSSPVLVSISVKVLLVVKE